MGIESELIMLSGHFCPSLHVSNTCKKEQITVIPLETQIKTKQTNKSMISSTLIISSSKPMHPQLKWHIG